MVWCMHLLFCFTSQLLEKFRPLHQHFPEKIILKDEIEQLDVFDSSRLRFKGPNVRFFGKSANLNGTERQVALTQVEI